MKTKDVRRKKKAKKKARAVRLPGMEPVTWEQFNVAFDVIERARDPKQGSCELQDESLRRLVQLLCGRSPVSVITQTTISDDITRIHVHRVLSETNGYELRNTL